MSKTQEKMWQPDWYIVFFSRDDYLLFLQLLGSTIDINISGHPAEIIKLCSRHPGLALCRVTTPLLCSTYRKFARVLYPPGKAFQSIISHNPVRSLHGLPRKNSLQNQTQYLSQHSVTAIGKRRFSSQGVPFATFSHQMIQHSLLSTLLIIFYLCIFLLESGWSFVNAFIYFLFEVAAIIAPITWRNKSQKFTILHERQEFSFICFEILLSKKCLLLLKLQNLMNNILHLPYSPSS